MSASARIAEVRFIIGAEVDGSRFERLKLAKGRHEFYKLCLIMITLPLPRLRTRMFSSTAQYHSESSTGITFLYKPLELTISDARIAST